MTVAAEPRAVAARSLCSASASNPFEQMVQRVQAVFVERTAGLNLWRIGTNVRQGNGSVSNAEQQKVQSAERYMAARLSGRNEEVLRLVADDVVLQSSRDGRVAGKHSFRDYIARVKPSGTWRKPTWNRSLNVAEVMGNVRILMLNVPVVAHFTFNSHGKIARINIGTRRKLSTGTQGSPQWLVDPSVWNIYLSVIEVEA